MPANDQADLALSIERGRLANSDVGFHDFRRTRLVVRFVIWHSGRVALDQVVMTFLAAGFADHHDAGSDRARPTCNNTIDNGTIALTPRARCFV
jgi:hypothetical protein